jgi:SAM-dependent MidA family methyltransferase
LLTESAELRTLIERRIRNDGPITFADFMELALYHPELGYYAAARTPMGRGGDYLTSPEVSSLFGYTIACHVLHEWQTAGEPVDWHLIELGPGSGALARDLLDVLGARSSARVRYTLVEANDTLRTQQQATLRGHKAAVEWLSSASELESGLRAHVLSNEFFDALPFHRVTVEAGEIREVFVALDEEGRLEDVVGTPSTSLLADYFAALKILPGEGNMAEVGLQARDTMRLVAGKLSSGTITTLDYGYEAAELYAPWRRAGTLLCFYQQASTDRPYLRIGRQDITAHVDFTSLAAAAAAEGFESRPLTTQMEFLTDLGIDELLQVDGVTLEESMARRRVVQTLLDPAGLGRIRVLQSTRR